MKEKKKNDILLFAIIFMLNRLSSLSRIAKRRTNIFTTLQIANEWESIQLDAACEHCFYLIFW